MFLTKIGSLQVLDLSNNNILGTVLAPHEVTTSLASTSSPSSVTEHKRSLRNQGMGIESCVTVGGHRAGHLRGLFQVDLVDYMLAICGTDALRELSSHGKSGSSFYLTQDDKFIIKTVKKSEVKVLIKMLPSYFQHACQYENSLEKLYGMHCVKPVGGPKAN